MTTPLDLIAFDLGDVRVDEVQEIQRWLQGPAISSTTLKVMDGSMPAPKRERKRARSAADLAKAAAKAGVEIIAADGTIFGPAPQIAPTADDATVIKTADELRKLI